MKVEVFNESEEYTSMISKSLSKEMKDFLKCDNQELLSSVNFKLIKKAYDQYLDDYNKFPPYNSMDLLDIKYDQDKKTFYNKYIDFFKKCKELSVMISPSGYGMKDFALLKIRDICRSVEYNFPRGWKW